ncbi:MAG: glycine--tRNA ligase [Nanoarchaeota archaeon]
MISIEEMTRFCKEKGFAYPNSEIYGGFSGFWDFGPLGVELKNNIKQAWWKRFVQSRQDVLGMEGSIITHPRIWHASGHVETFADIVLTCAKCKHRARADQYLEDQLKGHYEGVTAKHVNELVTKHTLCCPMCKGLWEDATDFNLMFQTHVGASRDKSAIAYLRPETAQLIFADFKLILETNRAKLPCGIAQIGKAFRNEISPRDFLFRSREFEQMEIEYFVHPDKLNQCQFFETVKTRKVRVLRAEDQHKGLDATTISIQDLSQLTTQWHAYWLAEFIQWFLDLGIKPQNLRLREHLREELAHYAGACFDIEYNFPFGWKEIHGNADRRQYDLTQHIKISGKDLSIFDEDTKQKVIPCVASEPSQGVERLALAILFDAYENSTERGNIVLHLHPTLAPIKIGVFPLVNKLDNEAKKIYEILRYHIVTTFDRSGSVGRRYARADEQGIMFCVTIDFETLTDSCVTIRHRDTTKQIRVPISTLQHTLSSLLDGTLTFEAAGKVL